MTTLLHLQASPRGERSASTYVASELIRLYQNEYSDDSVETLDVWKVPLPEISGDLLNAAYAARSGQPLTCEQSDAWQRVVQITDDFKAADKYVLSVPMWNFHIPYRLKHYLDLLVHSELTFRFSADRGFEGLVTGKPLTIVAARGGAYGPGSGIAQYDRQSEYLNQIFRFIGFSNIHEITVEPTAAGPDARNTAIANACAKAADVVTEF